MLQVYVPACFIPDSEIWSCELLNDVIPDQCKLRSAGKRLEIKLKKEKHGLWHGVGRVMEIDDVKVNSKEQQLPIKNGPQMQNHIQSVPQDPILHVSTRRIQNIVGASLCKLILTAMYMYMYVSAQYGWVERFELSRT